MIRAGRDDDAEGFIALIGACWSEYPGCILDVDGELPELRALASYYAQQSGALWAAERDGRVIGMVATRPMGDGAWELCRMYLDAGARGSGLGQRLLGMAEAHARAAGATHLRLWSDTRFHRAHAFYEKAGYLRQGPIRVLGDLSNSLEFPYAKPLRGVAVEALDAAAAASAERGLAAVLLAGAAAPMTPAAARAAWRAVAAQVAEGRQVLLVGWQDGVLAGAVQLDLGTAPGQDHRAALHGLLVDPALRRRGIGRALVVGAEQAAVRLGRTLLTLEARAEGPAARLCRGLGWAEAGRIPGHERDAAGQARDTAILWKRIG